MTQTGNPLNVYQPRGVSNQQMPSSVTALPITVDMSVNNAVTIDLTSAQITGKISAVQSAFIDNSLATASLSIVIPYTNQTITLPPQSQAYVPLLLPNPPIITLTSAAGSAQTVVVLLNVPMPLAVWSVNGPGAVDPATGYSAVTDPVLDACVVGNVLQVGSQLSSLTSRSQNSPNPAASFTIMGSNPLRRYFLVKAPETADLWINLVGGTASVDGADCIKLVAGSCYESPLPCVTTAIKGYTTATTVNVTAFEG
jgi:hypothetical protein